MTSGKLDPRAGKAPGERLLQASLFAGAGAVGLVTYALADRLLVFLVVGSGFLVIGATELARGITGRRREGRPRAPSDERG